MNKKVDFTIPHIKCLIHQLLKAVEYLHQNDVMHRDIKSANILLSSEGSLKLADFGLAKQYDHFRKMYTNKVVTLWYRAPELLLGSTKYNKSIDVWSIGCFLAELYVGKPIFPGDVEARQIDLIFKVCGTPDLESWPNLVDLKVFEELKPKNYKNDVETHFKSHPIYPEKLDDVGIDLIKGMLSLNPDKRLTVEEWLAHPYFTTEPLPCDKADLPKIEGEAHEHAIREERKEMKKALREKEAIQNGMAYPTSKHSYSDRRNGSGGNRDSKPHYSGHKRNYEDRERR